MFLRRFKILTILGFPIYLDVSWFIIAILIMWSLAEGVFPNYLKDLSAATYWAMGAVGAVGLFASILLHELGHAVVAKSWGLEMRGITLFIFGGVAEMADESPSAKAEFFVAVAGPIVSAVLAVVCLIGAVAGGAIEAPPSVVGVTAWLGWINAILVAFNIIPAFPLDGGRMLRALLWAVKDDLRWATKVTSTVGAVFGLALIGLGIVSILFGNFIGGLWWCLIGLFLRNAAQMSYRQLLIRRELEGEPVRRFMHAGPVTVPPDTTLESLVNDYVYRLHYKLYPVTRDGVLTGCVTTRHAKDVPRERWGEITVGDVADPCTDENTIREDEDAMKALAKMSRTGASRLLVVDQADRLVGVIALKDLLEFLSLKVDLEQ